MSDNSKSLTMKLVVAMIVIASTCALTPLKVLAQRGAPFSIVKEIEVKDADKDKIYKKAKNWLKNEDGVTLTRWNDDQCLVEASSAIPYQNDVVLEDILLSPNAALRTKGVINYTIRVSAADGKCKIEFTDFNHEAAYNHYGKISFGQILANDKVPLGKCFENTAWCNAVWDDMKSKIRKTCLGQLDNAKKKLD